jgi:exodeoxyribonuclease VIII
MKYGLFTDIPQEEYRKIDALANSDALMIEKNPSDYVWSKNAPTNFAKVQTKDIGTALHALLLEPETYDDLVIVSSNKGRKTKGFEQEVIDNPNNIVLTQEEAEQVRIMAGSVMAHPRAAQLLQQQGFAECSVIAQDPESGVNLKCRPDKDCVKSIGTCIDLKTTGDLSKWRADKEWLNPMYEFNYGHQAAFYLHTLSLHYGFEVINFAFIAVSSSVALGRYPVGVFEVSKDELIAWGFWSQMLANIDKFAQCKESNNWTHSEGFKFRVDEDQYTDDVEVVFDGDAQ